jgi:hypothetical protein
MAGRRIMGWCQELAISQPNLPIRRPFELRPAAADAFRAANLHSDFDHFGIGVIDYRGFHGGDVDK